ncbi:hypothetical protein [Flexivirga oryzae]|uniref:Uncharacterized protein n=1 Tax=Flexivirga oryzae TaxID=1794944 RepID=A0A839N2S2_9MICO|nr:hypothetical protein [Flexivirga oryzae]MBB2891617.1 hypothetical protein [Flexivirga oryzae]
MTGKRGSGVMARRCGISSGFMPATPSRVRLTAIHSKRVRIGISGRSAQ